MNLIFIYLFILASNFSATFQAGDVGRVNSQTKNAPEKNIYVGIFELKDGVSIDQVIKNANYDNLKDYIK